MSDRINRTLVLARAHRERAIKNLKAVKSKVNTQAVRKAQIEARRATHLALKLELAG